LIERSAQRNRDLTVLFRTTWLPRSDLPQSWAKPRKSNVCGLPPPPAPPRDGRPKGTRRVLASLISSPNRAKRLARTRWTFPGVFQSLEAHDQVIGKANHEAAPTTRGPDRFTHVRRPMPRLPPLSWRRWTGSTPAVSDLGQPGQRTRPSFTPRSASRHGGADPIKNQQSSIIDHLLTAGCRQLDVLEASFKLQALWRAWTAASPRAGNWPNTRSPASRQGDPLPGCDRAIHDKEIPSRRVRRKGMPSTRTII
jgi:hypothetical protein